MDSNEKALKDFEERHPEMDEGNLCESCGNYAESIKDVNGRMICEECQENISVV